jgi:hypothetical protein
LHLHDTKPTNAGRSEPRIVAEMRNGDAEPLQELEDRERARRGDHATVHAECHGGGCSSYRNLAHVALLSNTRLHIS